MNPPTHARCGLEGGLYRPLSDSDTRRIAAAAFKVLETSGMAVYSDTAFEALRAAGAAVDAATRIVRFPRAMVEDAIASTPSSITLHSRDGENDIVLEGSRVHYGTGGTALYVLDPDTRQRRPARVEDVVLNARMVQALPHVHMHTINVFPHDVTVQDDIDVNRFFHTLEHTTKHVMGGIYSLAGARKAVELAEIIAGSPAALREKPFVSFITLIISPFKIDDHYGEMTCYLARENLPVVVPTEPICGTTSPVTLAGNVLTHVAETLGGIVLVQAVRKGAPGICGSVGSIPDLRTMDHVGGAIERGMINAAVSQMAQYFRIPMYSTGGTSDAKSVNAQAGYESAMSALLVAMSGANYIHDIAGLMESDLTVSYEKLAMDNEMLGMCQRVLRGIEVTDETLAADLMISKGPGADYLVEDHTLRHMRTEFYHPTLANRAKREDASGLDAVTRARAFVDDLRHRPAPSLLDPALREAIVQRFPEILPAGGDEPDTPVKQVGAAPKRNVAPAGSAPQKKEVTPS